MANPAGYVCYHRGLRGAEISKRALLPHVQDASYKDWSAKLLGKKPLTAEQFALSLDELAVLFPPPEYNPLD